MSQHFQTLSRPTLCREHQTASQAIAPELGIPGFAGSGLGFEQKKQMQVDQTFFDSPRLEFVFSVLFGESNNVGIFVL